MDETTKKFGQLEEMVYAHTQIISMQNSIIDEQFQLLLQYMTVEELDRYPLLETMKSVGELCNRLDI